jgi:hypothetical protein
MTEKNHPLQIERIKREWHEAFEQMRRYYESESFKSFKIVYDTSTWYQFKNPALIFPAEREMRFSTPNQHIPFDYYPSLLAKCGITGHNFAYLADIEEYYPYNFSMFLWEQKEFITPLQRANLRTAQFIPGAVVAVTKEGVRSFLKARGGERGMGSYEEPLVILETLGLMGMPRRDDIVNFFREMSTEKAFDIFLETPYIFAFAGLATAPALNSDKKYGIRSRDRLTDVKTLVNRYAHDEMTYKETNKELEKLGYTTKIEDSSYKPEDAVDLRWVKLDRAMEQVKKSISVYEHKAAHSNFYCYADMADALKRLYEKERTAYRSYI